MKLNFKNTLATLLISTAIIACGGDKGSGNTSSFDGSALTTQPTTDGAIRPEVGTLNKEPMSKLWGERDEAKGMEPEKNTLYKFDGSALTTQSIADGAIRPEVKKAIKEAYSLIRISEYTNDPVKHQEYKKQKVDSLRKSLAELQGFVSNKQSNLEAKILNDGIHALEGLVNVNSITYSSEEAESTAIEKVVDRHRESLAQTIFQNLQSPKLKEYLTKIYQMESDRHSVSPVYNPATVQQYLKEFLAFYSSSSHDSLTKSEIKALDELGFLTTNDIQNIRRFAYPGSKPLSAETPNLSDDVSLRRARQGSASADFSKLMLNGVAGGYARLSLPVYVQLKGAIENSKETNDLTGTVVYKVNNTLVGMIHGHANASYNTSTSLNHNESSVVISHSFGKTYLEGQAGFIHSTINQQDISGERYQLSAGYDFEYLTPFVQASTRNLNAVNEHSVQAGCEVDVMNLVTDQYKLSTRMTLKGGYHSFKGTVGSVEGTFELGLNSGVTIQTGFKLNNNNESAAKISVSFDQ